MSDGCSRIGRPITRAGAGRPRRARHGEVHLRVPRGQGFQPEAAEAEAEDEAAEAAEAEEAEEAHENNAVAVPSQLEELAQLAKSFVRGTASDPAAKLINNILRAEVPEARLISSH